MVFYKRHLTSKSLRLNQHPTPTGSRFSYHVKQKNMAWMCSIAPVTPHRFVLIFRWLLPFMISFISKKLTSPRVHGISDWVTSIAGGMFRLLQENQPASSLFQIMSARGSSTILHSQQTTYKQFITV